MGDDSTDRDVVEPLAGLLNQLAREWVPPRFTQRQLASLRWGDEDITSVASNLQLEGHWLRIQCNYQRAQPTTDEEPFEGKRGPLSGRTHDGLLLEAKQALMTRYTTTHSESGTRFSVTISGHEYALWHPGRAVLWVGTLDIDCDTIVGNLTLRSPNSWSAGHLRLQGQSYHYYLLNIDSTKKRKLLAIDCGQDDHPSLPILNSELRHLSLAFGHTVLVGPLWGLDADRRTCGIVGGAFVSAGRGQWGMDTVPLNEFPRHVWIAPFFASLCHFFAHRDLGSTASVKLGIWYFLAALRDTSVDIRRSNMFLAISSVARYLVGDVRLIDNAPEWSSWLSRCQADIAKRARDGQVVPLLDMLERAINMDTEALVIAAMGKSGLDVTEELRNTLRESLAGLTGQPVEEQQAIRKLSMLRTIFVALVSSAIGYSGAITGWDMSDGGPTRANAIWWSRVDEDLKDAKVTYVAATTREVASVRDQWPSFTALTAPDLGPIAVVASFASALELKTEGRVLARVQPVPKREGDPIQMYDFVLYTASSLRHRTILFSMYETADNNLVIVDWEDAELTLSDQTKIEHFLSRVARAEETRLRVQSMLQVAELETD